MRQFVNPVLRALLLNTYSQTPWSPCCPLAHYLLALYFRPCHCPCGGYPRLLCQHTSRVDPTCHFVHSTYYLRNIIYDFTISMYDHRCNVVRDTVEQYFHGVRIHGDGFTTNKFGTRPGLYDHGLPNRFCFAVFRFKRGLKSIYLSKHR